MRFRHGELHLVLLALLSERRMHGYELMGELARRIRRYRPSPGSIYPAIQALETEGLITGAEEGDRTVYAVTDDGRAALVSRAGRLAELEARLGVRFADGIESTIARFAERVRALAPALDERAVESVLARALEQIEVLADGKGR